MSDQEAKSLVSKVFGQLKKSKSIDDLSKILDQKEISKYRISETTYSKINFKLTSEEIKDLKKRNHVNSKNEFSPNVSEYIKDPLTKLLYSLSWKNGDLKKIKHIIAGVLSENKSNSGLVFYQFGKHLSNGGEPIIDQHVIRAFAIFKNEDIKHFRSLSLLGKKEVDLITKYVNWVKSSEDLRNLRKVDDYLPYIDRILFATGKAIKIRSSKKSSE